MVNLNSGAIDDGNVTDPVLAVKTLTDPTAYPVVKVLPGETLADVAERVFGANSSLNRDKIKANNPDDLQEGPITLAAH